MKLPEPWQFATRFLSNEIKEDWLSISSVNYRGIGKNRNKFHAKRILLFIFLDDKHSKFLENGVYVNH